MRFARFGFLLGGVLAGLSLAAPAMAADLDFGPLRGGVEPLAVPAADVWDGFYIGGHGGWTSGSFGFGNVFSAPVAQNLRATAIEATLGASGLLHATDARRDGIGFGGYAGVNYQIDEIVVGVEALHPSPPDRPQQRRDRSAEDRRDRYLMGVVCPAMRPRRSRITRPSGVGSATRSVASCRS